jgi:hypothetical protein
MEVINWNVLRFFCDRQTFFLPLSSRLFPWTAAPAGEGDDGTAWEDVAGLDWVQLPPPPNADESDTRLYYELHESRAFFRRKLCEINGETFPASLAGLKRAKRGR